MRDIFNHWDNVYQQKDHSQVSWHQNHSTISLDWIIEHTKPTDKVIDVGCGVSVLADNLLEKGYLNLFLLEISTEAIETVKKRLQPFVKNLHFINQNILDFDTDQRFNLWHDRAVFHFLTKTQEQKTYITKLTQHLKPGGYFLLSTFALDGPKECSDLDVVQYDADKISTLLGQNFKLLKTQNEKHAHPNGSIQSFNYFLFQKLV